MIRVKPVGVLCLMLAGGVALLFAGRVWQAIGVAMAMFALFCLALLPDRVLVTFTPERLLLYNCSDRSECTMIYWDEIVSWQYEWHPASDDLVVTLTDGTMHAIELYSKRRAARYRNMYAPNKEIKNVRMKEGRV